VTDIAAGMDMPRVWDQAVARGPDRPFLVCLDRDGGRAEFTYGQFDALAGRAANALAAAGVSQGDRVILQLGNRPEFLAALLGVFALGAVAVPLHAGATAAEVARADRTSGATFGVADAVRSPEHAALLSGGRKGETGLWSVGATAAAEAAPSQTRCGSREAPERDKEVSGERTGVGAGVRAGAAPGETCRGRRETPERGKEVSGERTGVGAGARAGAAPSETSRGCPEAPEAGEEGSGGTASGKGAPRAGTDWAAALAAQPAVHPDRLPPDGGRLAQLLYTSGTTAAPKGVMVTHANMVFSGHYGVWQASLRGDDRLATSMPACHSNFQLAALTPVLAAGAQLILVEKYSASRYWEQVRAEGATVVQLIAMMVRTMLAQPAAPSDAAHSVRAALSFMPLAAEERDAFEERFGVRLANSYGSTESIGWSVTDPPSGERRWPSVGRPGLGYEAGVFDSAGRELAAGQVGELRIKGVPGRSLMAGYWEDPAATRAALTVDGWLTTHDQGYQDAEGWFYFVDRSVNLVKRAGENVSTAEVECVLTAHPLIAEAAVVGVPDPVRDQAVKAFVRLAPGASLTEAAIREHCRARLSAFKVPAAIEVVADFPRTPSMKIDKRLLAAASIGKE
jgi:crotonobetaine/carnitine-CoA ligase